MAADQNEIRRMMEHCGYTAEAARYELDYRRQRGAQPQLNPGAGRDMLVALRAFVAACGGNPPDWLRDEYAMAENAIALAEGKIP